MNHWPRIAALVAAGLVPGAAMGQELAQRIARSDAAVLQFTFAAREGVCGDGHHYISTGSGTVTGNFQGTRADPCVPGPVRVVVARASGMVVDLETYVGPPGVATGATDLGVVSAREAADFLLALAAESDGRPGRDAILPAALADSVTVAPRLLELARDQRRPRETRQRALSWAPWAAGEPIPSGVVTAIRDLARDERDNRAMRRHAVRVLTRLDRGAGIGEVLALVESDDSWLANESLTALSRSGDPRARPALRRIAEQRDASAEMRETAIRGLGRQYATASDAEFLRGLYASLDNDDAREAVIAALNDVGGAENVGWLLAVAGDAGQPVSLRRRAASSAARAGAPSADLVRLYDATTDRGFKRALVDLYAQRADAASVDKLLAIARTETDRNVRRRSISRLGRVDDPRVKEALRELVER